MKDKNIFKNIQFLNEDLITTVAAGSILAAMITPALIKNIRNICEKHRKNKEYNKVEEIYKQELKAVGADNLINFMKSMQRDCISHLKMYSSTSRFKNMYKKYLGLIEIKDTDYGDPFSIQITSYQNGLPDNYNYDDIDKDTSWYYDLLNEGKKYLEDKYKNDMKKYGIYVHTGDGDEGTIYICLGKYKKYI